MALFGFLRRENPVARELHALRERLAVLEAEMHPARLAEWHELAERLKRYLQRISAVEQRQKQREGEQLEQGDGKAAALALLHRTKFGNNGS